MSEEADVSEFFAQLGERLATVPAPEFVHLQNSGADFARRRLYLDEIGPETGLWFQQALDLLGSSTEPIRVYLNSPGGDVTAMFAIHDAIQTSVAPVHVYASGQVCSAAVLILACAHRRIVTESTCLMSHAGSLAAEDADYKVRKARRQWEDWSQSYWCELMARYTQRSPKEWKRDTEKEAELWLLGGAAIVAAGLADAVAERRPHVRGG